MNGVLVLGDQRGLRDALEFLLVGRARVRHASAAADTEGIDVGVVVVTDPAAEEHVRDVRVHPRMNDLPIVALTADPSRFVPADDVWAVDSTKIDVLDELTERVGWLIARASHPSALTSTRLGAA